MCSVTLKTHLSVARKEPFCYSSIYLKKRPFLGHRDITLPRNFLPVLLLRKKDFIQECRIRCVNVENNLIVRSSNGQKNFFSPLKPVPDGSGSDGNLWGSEHQNERIA